MPDQHTDTQTSPDATQPASEPDSASQSTQGSDELTFDAEYVRGLRNEARRHRTALREAEQQRDALQARLDVLDRAHVERLAAERMHDPSDLLDRTDLADLRAEDGTINEAAVREQVDALVQHRPHLARPPAGFDGGIRGTTQEPPPPPSFGEALKSFGA